MPLSAGDKLGPYEILAPIGAGGMGEVYRARDSRLKRGVAIKILPAAFANDADRMARFQREAQLLAALNHPHIAAIYGIEQSAIVMELVEGKNLAGPVPVEEAVAIARQIADALDAAHQKNIIHRDLKPANVKITPEGSVKVLDFGLAKAFDANPVSADPMNSPTITIESTRPGVILGTAGYMSPEQARGNAADKRADIWAFGAVFYELLTGCRAFKGETVSDTLASVLRSDPDWSKLPAGTPLSVRRLLERCLQRDPKKRLRDIGDAWVEMDRAADPPRQTKLHWVLGAVAVLAVLVAGAATWVWLHVPAPEPRTVTRSEMILAKDGSGPALSRDGSLLAYVQEPDGQLFLRMMGQLDGKPIPGNVYGLYPAFSPDGQWIAYFTSRAPYQLRKIPVAGGTPITLYETPNDDMSRPAWGLDDTIVVGSSKGLWRVPAGGGAPQSLTVVNTKNGETNHYAPQFLPGGQTILFSISHTARGSNVAVADIKTGNTHELVNKGVKGSYVPSGHLVYVRGVTLFAVPFDPKRLKVTGPETPVVDGIYGANYTFSDSSLLVFKAIGASDEISVGTLEWTNRQGVAQALPEPPRIWFSFSVSPEGQLVAASIGDPKDRAAPNEIWVYDLERRTLARLTFEGDNMGPVWTPDGRWVTYHSVREGKYEIYRVAADKSGQPQLLLTSESPVVPSSWTPDGKALLCTQVVKGKHHIVVLSVPGSSGESQPRSFSRTTFNELDAQVAPDGKWVAYVSDESGKNEVYVVPFSGSGGKTQVSTQGGDGPRWSRNGRELFYVLAETNQLMAVDVQTGPVFRARRPKALFKLVSGSYEVTPDPNRFLVERMPERKDDTRFVTITDWFDDLRRRVPVKK